MGTGSFGGGSGSYGGGGSGSSGRGGKSSGQGSRKSGKNRTGSVFQLITSILRLSQAVNENPGLTQARKVMSDMLQDPGRAAFLSSLLGSPFINGLFTDLLTLSDGLSSGFDWNHVATAYNLDKDEASLGALLRALVAKYRSRSNDERYIEIGRRAVSDLLLKAIDNDLRLFMRASPEQLNGKFKVDILRKTCGYFLSGLIHNSVLSDVMKMSEETQLSMDTTSREFADAWFDRFTAHYRSENCTNRDFLETISAHYREFVSPEQPR